MTDLETILSWFQTGDMPTQEEFQQTFLSFRHKNTKIPLTEVEGLEAVLVGDEGGIWIFPAPVTQKLEETSQS